jgi:ABC-type transport system substrate-binding protein
LGLTGAATLAVVGCGDDDDDGGNGGGGLLPTAEATPTPAKQAKPGGSFSFQISSPPPSLDPYTQTSFVNAYMNGLSYSKLYRFRAGTPDVAPADNSMEPDLATAIPEQPDQLTLTIKLKPAKFHNGRQLTSEDIRYAFDRYMNYDKSVHKTGLAWIDKIETPDAQTVKLTTKYPYADAVYYMGGNLGAWISPRASGNRSGPGW